MHYLEEVARKENIVILTVFFQLLLRDFIKSLDITRYAMSTPAKKEPLSLKKNYPSFLSVRFRTIGLQTPNAIA